MDPLKKITQHYSRIQQGLAAAERVFEIIDVEPQLTSPKDAVNIDTLRTAIEFENVSFTYENTGMPALHNIDLTIPKGQKVALVGKSGAGKSTLADLIARFYDVTDGVITFDGIDVRMISLESLRRLMGIVTQEIILFNETVESNIAYGESSIDSGRVESALIAANAKEFVSAMPDGVKTMIGDRGTKLSGGERQRLAIARAIYFDPQILIFDEATSALDNESEQLVQDAIDRLLEGRTAIIVAHRLSTVRNADKIVVLDKGKIVEVGNHEQLMQKNGKYRELYTKTDSGAFIDEV